MNSCRVEIVSHAVRWSGNILAEVLSNHGKFLNDADRECIRLAVLNLGDYRGRAKSDPDNQL
jgi:hypothetical protein